MICYRMFHNSNFERSLKEFLIHCDHEQFVINFVPNSFFYTAQHFRSFCQSMAALLMVKYLFSNILYFQVQKWHSMLAIIYIRKLLCNQRMVSNFGGFQRQTIITVNVYFIQGTKVHHFQIFFMEPDISKFVDFLENNKNKALFFIHYL